jgi:primosomal protein N' (replication factor Y)
MEKYARVAVNVPGLKDQFDYEIPETIAGDILPGCLVEVPFGAQMVQGVVTRLMAETEITETRPISALIDDLPALTPTQMELAEILARATLAPMSDFLNLMLPPGLSQRADSLYSLNLPEDYDLDPLTPLQQRIIQRLQERGPLRGRQLETAFRHVDWRRSAQALARKGLLISHPVLPKPKVSTKTARTVRLAISNQQLDEALEKAGREGSAARERRQAILRLLASENEALDVSYVYASSGGNSTDLSDLYKKGFIHYGEEEVLRDPLAGRNVIPDRPPILTQEQKAAWTQVEKAMDTPGASKPILLHGVTGSGKTELYMHAIKKALSQGRQAIVLVPEISLTPQTIERFTARFGRQVGVIHSKLSPGERYDTWRRAREVDFSIAIGPRSALFTPFPNTGVIVLDEFHDESYIQTEINPYYNAIEAAIELGRLNQALVILGSATPDVSVYFRAEREKWPQIELTERILAHGQMASKPQPSWGKGSASGASTSSASGKAEDTLPLPEVSVVDMREELRAGNSSIFSRELNEQIGLTLANGEQAILLLNRRGTSTWVFCRDCGHTLKCPRCDLPLTWHGGSAQLVCHVCGYTRKMPAKCPNCSSTRIKQFGTGTEKVESELQALYPHARLLRWDADTASGKGAEEVIMAHFRQHNADILIGTQMLAKGLDLPLVTLVGAVLADAGLNFPDYRTAERAFQLLTQAAGRAGRSALGGRVVLQTFQPEHYAIRHAAGHDFKGFYAEEIDQRRALRYPPFVRMVRFETRDLKNEKAREAAQAVYRKLQRLVDASTDRSLELNPPVPPYFTRRAGYFRWQVILKGSDPVKLIRDEDFGDARVEVDPPSLL